MPGELVKITGVADFIRASKAKNTQVAYASDLRDFERWCTLHSTLQATLHPLPASPETVATYLAALASTHKYATIRRRAAAIAFGHRAVGADNPIAHPGVKQVIEGIARTLGSAPVKKAALTAELLGKAVRKIPVDKVSIERRSAGRAALKTTEKSPISALQGPPAPDLTGLRDRAMLLLGFAAALRRSELVDLNVNDVTRHHQGAYIIVRRSKTDQTGQGLTKAIPHGKKLKAIEALDAWLAAAGITEGPIFRAVHGSTVLEHRLTAGQVARVIKKRCAAIGLDPQLFSGHSLRRGFLTSASDHGASLQKMAKHAGHSKLETTVGYIEESDSFRQHPGSKFL